MKHGRTAFWTSAALFLGVALSGALPVARADATPDEAAQARADLARARGVEADLVSALGRVRRATVSVLHRRRPKQAPWGPLVVAGVGSGVLVRQGGTWVLTNFHVVDGAEALEIVTHDGRIRSVTVSGKDEASDLALLALGKDGDGLEAVDLEEKPLPVQRGTWVLALGNPFLLANDGASVATLGIVSDLFRRGEASEESEGTIQHDAAVNPGNSGGPLWSLTGRLLGINETIATHSRTLGSGPHSTGASFSVGIDRVREVVTALVPVRGERAPSHRRPAPAATLGEAATKKEPVNKESEKSEKQDSGKKDSEKRAERNEPPANP